jgi:hypothetical protein
MQASGGGEANGAFVVTAFDKTALTNIRGCSNSNSSECQRMGAHVLANYLIAIIVMKVRARLRAAFLVLVATWAAPCAGCPGTGAGYRVDA